MKIENNHIDELFQSKLAERSFDIPASFLTDLEAKLDAERKKGGAWIAFASLLFFASLIGASYVLLTNNVVSNFLVEKNTNQKPFALKNSNQNLLLNSTKITTKRNQKIEKIERNTPPNKNHKLKTNDFEKNNLVGLKKGKKGFGYGSNGRFDKISKGSVNPADLDKIKASTYTASRAKSASTDLIISKNTAQNNSKLKRKISLPLETIKPLEYENTLVDLFPSKEKRLVNKSTFSDETNSYAENLFDDTTKITKRNFKDSIIFRDSIIYKDSVVIRDSVVLKYQKDPNRKLKFETQLYAGFMRVQPKIVSPFNLYAAALQNAETKIISPDFGFHLNAYYKKWTIGTGLKYYQFGEKTNYSTLKVTTALDSIHISMDSVFLDSFGLIWDPQSGLPISDTIINTFMDTIYSTNTQSQTKQWQNSYTRFVIPLNFGYRIDYKDWALIPRVGLNFEFTTARQKGLYINVLQEEFIELEQKKFGLSYQLSIELRRSFGNWHAFLNPYYRNNTGFTIDTPELKRRYGGFGANFGVGLEF